VKTVEPEKHEVSLPSDFKLLVTSNDPDARAMLRYLTKRGVTERELWLYKVGFSDESHWRRRVLIPSYDKTGKLNYFVGRAIDDSRWPKYDNPFVTERTSLVFNELNVDWAQRLVLCEGTFDMFKCGDNVVPLLGSDINEEYALFNEILVNKTPVALALDGDMWYTKTPRIVAKFLEYDIDVKVVDTRELGDPGNVSKQRFAEALNEAKSPVWIDSFMDRLSNAVHVNLKIR
jgi:hypothetical protein